MLDAQQSFGFRPTCSSDLLSGILAVPAKFALEIDESFLNTHFVFFHHGAIFGL